MHGVERRRAEPRPCRALERELNTAQICTLRELEHFGWELKFVRHPRFEPIVPIVFDSDRKCYAVIEPEVASARNPISKRGKGP